LGLGDVELQNVDIRFVEQLRTFEIIALAVAPPRLQMTAGPSVRINAASVSTNFFTPGFSSPMLLSMPDGVS
jgi:hypothetical protein